MLTDTLFHAGLVPLVVALVGVLATRQLRAARQIALATGFALGYIAAQFVLRSQAGMGVAVWTMLRPTDAADWLPLLTIVAWAVTVLLASGWRPSRYVAAAFAVTVPLRLLAGHARITREWSVLEKLGSLSLLAGLVGLVWWLLATDDEEHPASGRLVCVVAVAVAIAIALTLSGSFTHGQLAGAVAASLTGAALASFFPLPLGEGRGESVLFGATGSASAKRLTIAGFTGAAGITACLLVGLILLGHFYDELSTANAALLIAALIIASAPLPKALTGHPAWLHLAARLLLCLTPVAIALFGLFNETSQGYGY